jgi:multiple sugar transport system permease protein
MESVARDRRPVTITEIPGGSRHRQARPPLGVIARWLTTVVASIVALFPIWWMVNVVFAPSGAGVALAPRLWPTSFEAGMANLEQVLADPVFVPAFGNSLIYSGIQVIAVLIVTSMAAFEFANRPGRGRRLLFSVCLIGLMVPAAVTLLPTQRLIVSLGWLNTIPGIVLPGIASSFALFILTEYMRGVPRELIEAATVDGASNITVYWRIALPLCRNGLFAVGILVFILAWANYLWPLVVAIDPGKYPVSVAVAGYFAAQSHTTINQVMAASLISIAPVVVIYVILQRWIVEAVARVGIRG